jgi:hypothetical protein
MKVEGRGMSDGESGELQAALAVRPRAELQLDLSSQLDYAKGEPRFAWHATAPSANPAEHLFGRLLARSIGATLRASYAFTPRLSLQAYGQLFLASGHYTDFTTAVVAAGATRQVRLASLQPYLGATPGDADFEQAALNVNVVLRWEYRLGSTLFLVYTRSQVPNVGLAPGEVAALQTSAIGRVPAVDTLLLKLSFWWAS